MNIYRGLLVLNLFAVFSLIGIRAFAESPGENIALSEMIIGTSVSLPSIELQPSPVIHQAQRLGRTVNVGEITSNSGSPVLVRHSDGSYAIVGIHSGKTNQLNGRAVSIVPVITELNLENQN